MVSSPVHVATYERTVRASLPRVWENVHDWEHLPWLHHSTFSSIELLGSGDWGWRARVGLVPAAPGREIEIELRATDEDRYRVVTLAGEGQGTEIWTVLTPRGDAETGIRVEFHVPGVEPGAVAGVGAAFTSLYARLWDEDESMMRRRSDQLARRRRAPAGGRRRVALGPLGSLPRVVEADGCGYRLVAVGGQVLAHATVCPHRLGPLEDAEIEDGAVRCPWHGYRFDLRTGCSRDGRRLRLPPAPRVEQDDAGGWLVFGPDREEGAR